LRYYPAFTTDGGMGALSNNILGGQPEHPWFHLLTNNLIPYDWNWLLPYVVVMYCTGQWYVTAIFEKYHSLLAADGTVRGFDGVGWAPLHHILMDGRPGADPWVFFTQVRGGSWDDWDKAMFDWIGDHILLVIFGVVGLVGLAVWRCCCRRAPRDLKYQRLPD